MDPFDEAITGLANGDPEKTPLPETSTSHDDPLDKALLDMVPVIPEF